MKRRTMLLAIPATAAGGTLLWLGADWLSGGEAAGEVDFDEQLPAHLLPCEPGLLPPQDRELLWTFCQRIGDRFGMDALGREDLLHVLDLKTSSPPSYLAEYKNALAFLQQIATDQWGSLIDNLLETEVEGGREWLSRAHHFRLYVFEELVSLHLIRGGCRATSAVRSYRGLMTETLDYRHARG